MAKDKTGIREFAKNLYLEVNETGERVYSYQDIADLLLQKCNKKVTRKTIGDWVKADNWDLLLQTAKNLGIEKALKEKENKEELIKDAVSHEVSETYKTEDEKYNLSSSIVLSILQDVKRMIDGGELTGFSLVNIMKDVLAVANTSFGNRLKLSEGTKDTKLDELIRLFENA